MYLRTNHLGHAEIMGDSQVLGRERMIERGDLDDGAGSWWSKAKSLAKSTVTVPFKSVKYSFTAPYKLARSWVKPNEGTSFAALTRFSTEKSNTIAPTREANVPTSRFSDDDYE